MGLTNVLKTENIIKISSSETLSSALTKLSSSHDAAFVFDNEDHYLGAINPYYCLIKSSYPANAKVMRCLYHPAKVRLNYSLVKVAQLFIDTKVHYLPVFDEKDNFLGIISARRLISYFKEDSAFKVKIKEILKQKKALLTIFQEETVDHALKLFKESKFSKLVVVDRYRKLKGILSYFDLVYYLASPKKSFSVGERKGERNGFFHLPVKNFMKSYVLTLTEENYLSEVINLILNKKIGSVVIVKEKKEPVGIITTRDILKFFIEKEIKKQKPPVFRRFFKMVSLFFG